MKKVIIASQNPIKIEAVKNAFAKCFPSEKYEFYPTKSESKVAEQPMSEEETLLGVNNRIKFIRNTNPEADYYVAIESGCFTLNGELFAEAWIYVSDKSGYLGKGRTGAIMLPKKIVNLMAEGKELGHAGDMIFNQTNIKQQNGVTGLLTKDFITRGYSFEMGMILALVPFMNTELYLND